MMKFGRALLAALVLAIGLSTQALAATCYITEFGGGLVGGVQVAVQPALVEQTVAITGASVASTAFGGGTRIIRLHCDAIASFKVGVAPVVTTSSARMPADAVEYFLVNPGEKIAVISNI